MEFVFCYHHLCLPDRQNLAIFFNYKNCPEPDPRLCYTDDIFIYVQTTPPSKKNMWAWAPALYNVIVEQNLGKILTLDTSLP